MARQHGSIHLGPLAALLREGAIHYLCSEVPSGILVMADVNGTIVTWKCTHCGEQWVVNMGIDIDFNTVDDLIAEAEAAIPFCRPDQINELKLLFLSS